MQQELENKNMFSVVFLSNYATMTKINTRNAAQKLNKLYVIF